MARTGVLVAGERAGVRTGVRAPGSAVPGTGRRAALHLVGEAGVGGPGRPVVRRGGITRRGRLVLGVVAALVLACVFVLGRSSASSAAESGPAPSTVVAPGQTLWSIAHELSPQGDTRRTVQRLADANHLDPSAPLHVGQVLVLPRR